MDIQLEKRKVMNMLEGIEDPAIIKAVKKLLTKNKKDWWDDLTEAQKEDIELGIEDSKNGNVVSYESVMKKHLERSQICFKR